MNKKWSGRFTKETKGEVEAFTASIFFDSALVEEDILGSLAHAKMLGKVGIITEGESKQIQQGLCQVLDRFSQGTVSLDASDEDIHMKVESELQLLIGPLAGKLHTARSRNDQVALDLHLFLRSKVVHLVNLIQELNRTLTEQATMHLDVIMPGYTHLQRAQPILFSHHLLAYVACFERDIQRLQESWSRINQLPLGACALAGTGFPIDRQMVAHLLKFDGLYENSIDAVSDRDFVIEFLSNCSLIMTHLSRLSEEVVLWCSQEFAFIELDDAYCTGSSIMPQKKNPDVPELVRGKTGRVYGALMASLTLLKGLPLSYNKDLQEDKEIVFDTCKTLETSLAVYIGLIGTWHVRSHNMLNSAKTGFLNATQLADDLASKGLPFRESHAIVGQMVRYCLDHGLKLEDLSEEQFKGFSPLFDRDVLQLLDLQNIVNAKNSLGGTSIAQVKRQIETAQAHQASIWILEKQNILAEAKKLFSQ
jgi:argininosuccinate lyase